ncbi:hypothetical protein PR202_ga26655 [Eleusine coracana subsp. coracana]|uniref:Uncharacterized protein n=1 Tax=Eleusine coracana subsp. coracana TaxID=191504 RepID=A0AAV5DDV9_ELECO|nr:hypothetical protein PR202_ga26655 [Eleusine coracana subsp. coracana]
MCRVLAGATLGNLAGQGCRNRGTLRCNRRQAEEEFGSGARRPTVHIATAEIHDTESSAEVPRSVDWREPGAVTPIRDQGLCVCASSKERRGLTSRTSIVVGVEELTSVKRFWLVRTASSNIVSDDHSRAEGGEQCPIRRLSSAMALSVSLESPLRSFLAYSPHEQLDGQSLFDAAAHLCKTRYAVVVGVWLQTRQQIVGGCADTWMPAACNVHNSRCPHARPWKGDDGAPGGANVGDFPARRSCRPSLYSCPWSTVGGYGLELWQTTVVLMVGKGRDDGRFDVGHRRLQRRKECISICTLEGSETELFVGGEAGEEEGSGSAIRRAGMAGRVVVAGTGDARVAKANG